MVRSLQHQTFSLSFLNQLIVVYLHLFVKPGSQFTSSAEFVQHILDKGRANRAVGLRETRFDRLNMLTGLSGAQSHVGRQSV